MEKLIGYGLIGFALYSVYTHAMNPIAKLKDLSNVATSFPDFKLLGTPDDATGTFKITDKASGRLLGAFYLDDRGGLHESPEQAASGAIKGTYEPVITALRLGVDLGAFAGVSKTQGAIGGLRISPARIFDNIAPDIIVGPKALGVGASFYLPKSVGPTWLSHVGLGAWYTSDLHGAAGPVVGLTLSTH